MKTTQLTSIAAAALLTLAGSVYAQAPAGTTSRTAQEADANKSGGPAAAKAEMNTQAKKSGMHFSSSSMGGSMKAMDTNGDGMISKAEWDTYHSGVWGKMKLKNGMAASADVEAAMKPGGPN